MDSSQLHTFFFALSIIFLTGTSLDAQSIKLIPVPREVRPTAAISLTNGIEVTCASPCDPEDAFAVSDFNTSLAARGITVSPGAATHILVLRYSTNLGRPTYRDSLAGGGDPEMPAAMKSEGYVIIPDGKGLALTADSASGIFYALQTIKQLITGNGTLAILHAATIRDWPAMKYRGLDDDLSRGPVPTFDYQKKQIRTLAAYKVNIYSPYFEHTMQYTSLPLMEPPGGTITQAQARELVAYAAQYHITIIPEQEAFGHLHYLLNWEQYAPLAEIPHGHVLAPGQAESLKITKDMFTELANIYPGPFLHIGADETGDLGKGQTKAAVDAQGLGTVYLDYMQKIVTELQPLHRKLLFWGDIAMHDPDLVKKMPDDFKKATIAVAWEYNPQPKGFAPYITPFTDAGIETWVAPGINNWSRVYPNWNNGLNNIQHFTADGQRLGATGQLNTIWDDDGEALADNNWYGILFGAEAAWHQGEASIPAFQSSFGQVFHDDATGKIDEAQRELMAGHQLLKDSPFKTDAGDLTFWIDPWSVDGQRQAVQLRPSLSELRLHAERAMVLIAQARNANPNLREQDAIDALDLGARRMDFIGLKFQLADEMAASYAHAYALQGSKAREDRSEVSRELGQINNAVNGKLQDLSKGYAQIRDLYETAWLKSNRPYFLRNNLERYDYTIAQLYARIDKVRSAQRQWTSSQTLPPAADLGIPTPPSAVTH